MNFDRLADLDLKSKRVFIRADLNVPQDNRGNITDDTRIRASLAAVQLAIKAGARVFVTSHLGRPTEGSFRPEDSLAPIAQRMSELLGVPMPLIRNWVDGSAWVDRIQPGQVVMLENCRLNVGEKDNDEALSRKMAALCDVYANDAFGSAHRSEATTEGMAKYAPIACAGPLLAAELDALGKALSNPALPLVAVVGGSKVSTKLTILDSLSDRVDQLIVGGGIANTFLAARGRPIGKSLAQWDLVDEALGIVAKIRARGGDVPLPIDVVCAKEFSADAFASVKSSDSVEDDDLILDIGPQTRDQLTDMLRSAGTIVWNGPVGVFEIEQFGAGTKAIAEAIAASPAFSIAGGGDTLAAIAKYGVADKIDYVSTGGGAFLEFLEGKTLPAVAILEQRARR